MHLLAAVAFGPYATGEISDAANLWASLPHDSLTIVDRGFFSAKILIPLARGGTNRHWLIRAKRNLQWRVLRRLAPRDALVERALASPGAIPKHLRNLRASLETLILPPRRSALGLAAPTFSG